MDWLFRYNYSTSHLFVPRIIIAILIVLGVLILLQKALRKNKTGRKPFFKPDTDYVKLIGTVVLLIVYVWALEQFHFVPASLVCIFLFNVLFCGTFKLKSLAISAASTAFFVLAVNYIFGTLFNITLP